MRSLIYHDQIVVMSCELMRQNELLVTYQEVVYANDLPVCDEISRSSDGWRVRTVETGKTTGKPPPLSSRRTKKSRQPSSIKTGRAKHGVPDPGSEKISHLWVLP
jgi:hypothetical protein